MVNASIPPTLNIPSSSQECSLNTLSSSPRRLSQTITDIVTGGPATRSRSSSSPGSPSPIKADSSGPNKLTIEFEGGARIIVRPNRVVRGVVMFNVVKPVQASQIRIRHFVDTRTEAYDDSSSDEVDFETPAFAFGKLIHLAGANSIITPESKNKNVPDATMIPMQLIPLYTRSDIMFWWKNIQV